MRHAAAAGAGRCTRPSGPREGVGARGAGPAPAQVARLPRPVLEDRAQVHLLQARGAGVLLAHDRPAAYALRARARARERAGRLPAAAPAIALAAPSRRAAPGQTRGEHARMRLDSGGRSLSHLGTGTNTDSHTDGTYLLR
jgi:hypothetical protein